MTCRTVEPFLVDLARGVALDAGRHADVAGHVYECHHCAARLEEERAMSAALGRVARDAKEPAPNPDSERAVFAAFDAAWAEPRSPARFASWRPDVLAGSAALLGLAAVLTWAIAHSRATAPAITPPATAGVHPTADAHGRTDRTGAPAVPTSAKPARLRRRGDGRGIVVSRASDASRGTTEFVPWPGASALPTFESGQLMRMDLPASVVLSLGLMPAGSQAGVVRTDVIVGQDGFARAVRLVR